MNPLLSLLKSALIVLAAVVSARAADPKPSAMTPPKLEKATFGAGCFWGV